MSTFANYWYVPAIISLGMTAYLFYIVRQCKRLRAGRTTSIMKAPLYKSENPWVDARAVSLSLNFSLGLALIAAAAYGACSVLLVQALIVAINDGQIFLARIGPAVVLLSNAGALVYAWFILKNCDWELLFWGEGCQPTLRVTHLGCSSSAPYVRIP